MLYSLSRNFILYTLRVCRLKVNRESCSLAVDSCLQFGLVVIVSFPQPIKPVRLHLSGIRALMVGSSGTRRGEAVPTYKPQNMANNTAADKAAAAAAAKAAASELAKATAPQLAQFGFSLTKLPSQALKGQKKVKASKTAIVWPVDVARAAAAMGVALPDLAPVKGASAAGTLVAGPSKDAKAARGSDPVRLPFQLDRNDAGPCWALYVANGGRFDDGQATQFPDMSKGESLPLVTLLATLNPAELSGKAFQMLYTGAGSQGLLRTIAQYSGRTVTLSLADFTISLG